MKVAMMQPSFMPWLGYFELIRKSDKFIVLDDFQFSVQSYHQRNRLFVSSGQVGWYSVPVKKSVSFKSPLNQTKIDESGGWRAKMWKRIQYNYAKTAYYNEIAPFIEKWLLNPAESLAEQNITFVQMVCDILDYKKEILYSSQFESKGERSERVVELLHACSAKQYYSAKGSFDYMREDGVFPLDDISVHFQDFQAEPYAQVGSKEAFVPFLSVVDALMNVGPAKTAELIQNGTKYWLTWETMCQATHVTGGKEEQQ